MGNGRKPKGFFPPVKKLFKKISKNVLTDGEKESSIIGVREITQTEREEIKMETLALEEMMEIAYKNAKLEDVLRAEGFTEEEIAQVFEEL